jgi:16S rRNA (guanine1207-N2)-methyltransferase
LSDNGVFSKNKIDYASELLVNTIISNTKNCDDILDVGCGYGFIGITLSKMLNSHVTMVDVNNRAIHLAPENIKKNKINGEAFNSDIYENITGKYNLIVSNPPIRAGKNTVLNILRNAKDYLKDNGVLWFVINKNQGAKSIIKELEDIYKIHIKERSKGFYVIMAEILAKNN